MSDAFPNVHARMHVSIAQPSAVTLELELDIWLAGTRFHVRDSRGRSPDEILGDVSYHRGMGIPLRTIEEMMDRASQMSRPPFGTTDLFGDLATGEGVVEHPFERPWPMPAAELAPAAMVLLADHSTGGLTAGTEVDHDGRRVIPYTGAIHGDEHGARFHTELTRLVAGPYVVLDLARDSVQHDLYLRREVVLLEEGTVADADLTPPPI